MALTVVDVPARSRYEVTDDGRRVGHADYRRTGNAVAFTHTVVEPARRGEGVGSVLVRAAVADVRRQGLAVRPLCSFVQDWLRRHPEDVELSG